MKTPASQSRKTGQGSPAKSKDSLYQQVTDKLIAQMEKGIIPWKRPWKILDNGAAEMPTNYVTKKSYRGINLMLLSCNTYSRPYYMTFRQAQFLGGNVKKGEKGHMVLFYKTLTQQQEEGSDKKVFYERMSFVFNIDQIEGINFKQPNLYIGQPDEKLLIERCEQIYRNYPNAPKRVNAQLDRAFYRVSRDEVNMPPVQAFRSPFLYYNTLFHELTHSTGHERRLNRPEMGAGQQGSELYNREELTAELGAAFLSAVCGISQEENSTIDRHNAAYLQHYLLALRADVSLFYKASQQAQKAVDYILDRSYQPAEAGPIVEEQKLEMV